MPRNASDSRKGKKVEAKPDNNFSGNNSIEMDKLEILSEQTIAALSIEVKSTAPFSLLEHYKGNTSSSSRTYHYTKLPKGSDKDTAQELLISALKLGDDRYINLVSLLLDDSPIYAERQEELGKLFAQNQKTLLPIKQHLCILSAMQDILRDVIELLVELSPPMVDRNEFYNQLIARLTLAKNDYIRGQFDINVGMYLKDERAREQAWLLCLQSLQNYLPDNIEQAYQSYFAIAEDGNAASLFEKIEQAIADFDRARDIAQKYYEYHCKHVAELEECLTIDKRVRREKLIVTIMQTKNKEHKSGVHYLYKEQISGEELYRLAGLVPYNAIDNHCTNQSNLALIALQYNNSAVYRKFFSSHKDLAETAKTNQIGLSAEHYDKTLFWQDKSDKEMSALIIKKKDSKGELLRKLEKEIHQYLQDWHKKNSRLRQTSKSKDLTEKMMVALIALFNNQELFAKRQEEANEYLQLVQKAMNDIPAEFFKGLEKLLNESDWGILRGSQLHNMMDRYRKAIQSNNDYRILVNSTPELIERVRTLEETIRQRDFQHQQDLQQQKEEHERTLKAQQEAIKVTFSQENSELKTQVQAQAQKMQVQEQQLQTQAQQLQTQAQQLQAIMARLSQVEQKQSSPQPSDEAADQPMTSPVFFNRGIG